MSFLLIFSITLISLLFLDSFVMILFHITISTTLASIIPVQYLSSFLTYFELFLLGLLIGLKFADKAFKPVLFACLIMVGIQLYYFTVNFFFNLGASQSNSQSDIYYLVLTALMFLLIKCLSYFLTLLGTQVATKLQPKILPR